MSAPHRIVFGGYQGPNSVHTRGAGSFAAALHRLTDGKAEVLLRPDITRHGHKAADLLGMVEAGEIDGCYFSSSYLAGRVPSLALFDMVFAAPVREDLFARLDGELGRWIAADVASRTGFEIMGYWDNGLRHISAGRPLTGPEGCAGLSLRTLASDDHQRAFRALGFEPRVIDVKDLAAAVAAGEVDAQENPLTNIYKFRPASRAARNFAYWPLARGRACLLSSRNGRLLARGSAPCRARGDERGLRRTTRLRGIGRNHLSYPPAG